MKAHLEVLHDDDGWRTACGAASNMTTSSPEYVDCLQCRCTKAFKKATQEPSPAPKEKA